jgi:hypothetical protein
MTTQEKEDSPVGDTARLRGLAAFPRVKVLLGEFIRDRKLVPSGSRDVEALDALPNGLKASLQRAERNGRAWCAWSTEGEVFAVTGHLDDTSSRMHAKPVLQVFLYDGKGRTIASSKWLEVQANRWTACES